MYIFVLTITALRITIRNYCQYSVVRKTTSCQIIPRFALCKNVRPRLYKNRERNAFGDNINLQLPSVNSLEIGSNNRSLSYRCSYSIIKTKNKQTHISFKQRPGSDTKETKVACI